MVFAGRSHPDLAQNIAEKLGVELGDVELETFANDETYCRYLESIRGADVFIVQTGVRAGRQQPHGAPVHDPGREARVGEADHGGRCRWFPYARQDRKAKPREPISARLVADMLQLAGADRVLTMDLHAGQIQGFFTIPVDHMTALPLFATPLPRPRPDRRRRRLGRARRGSREARRPLRGDDRGRASRSCTRCASGPRPGRRSPRSRAGCATRSRSSATT